MAEDQKPPRADVVDPDGQAPAEVDDGVVIETVDEPADEAGELLTPPPMPEDEAPVQAELTVEVAGEEDELDEPEIPSLVGQLPWQEGDGGGPVEIAFAGGKGGAGRSTLVANVGLFLSRLGRDVVLADLDPAGQNLHTFLGMDPILPTPGMRMRSALPPRVDRMPGMNLRLCRPHHALMGADDPLRQQALDVARASGADVIVLDLGVQPDPLALDTFLEADCGVVVTLPEPAAMERTYAFLRAALYRRLLDGDDEPAVVSRALLTADHVGQLDTPAELIDALAGVHPNAAQAIRARVLAFAPKILVNRCGNRADRDLAAGICSALRRRWNINAEALGGIDADDTALESLRRRRPLVVEYPGSALARDIERLTRRLMALVGTREVRP
ncbi:MAG: P-loop NTPase [Myxococcales bacterium]|nr:P-loop NTPase [Myxococcales bacterium]